MTIPAEAMVVKNLIPLPNMASDNRIAGRILAVEYRMTRTGLFSAVGLSLLPLSCSTPQHAVDEKYYLIATNTAVPYWQEAKAGPGRSLGHVTALGRNGRHAASYAPGHSHSLLECHHAHVVNVQ